MNIRERIFKGFTGCSNHGCVISKNDKGMHTNSICRCLENMTRSQLSILSGRLQAVFAKDEEVSDD